MAGKLQFQFDFSNADKAGWREGSRKRILIVGDYSAHKPDKPKLNDRKPQAVDIDDFDAVLRRISPQLRIFLGDSNEETLIEFLELDDFHPDALYKRLSVFKTLREMRGRLENPSTYAAAAEELKRGMTATPPLTVADEPKPAQAATDDAKLFDRLLGGQAPTAGNQP